MKLTDEALAIPLWINGHAYLTLAPAFLDVCNPLTGQRLRRTPLCGAGEARAAVAAASAALPAWRALSGAARAALLTALGDALAAYGDHFAGLIGEETGEDVARVAAEVAAAVTLLRSPPTGDALGVAAIVARAPLLACLRLAVPALMAGATVVVRPPPRAPSALFALAELTGRCGFPPGVFNVLHGDEAAIDGLRNGAPISLLFA